jgi:hypothetical protein
MVNFLNSELLIIKNSLTAKLNQIEADIQDLNLELCYEDEVFHESIHAAIKRHEADKKNTETVINKVIELFPK